MLTDIPSYLIGIISTSLLFQLHQTYRILKDPQEAIRTITYNLQAKLQIVFVALYTIFLIADVVIVFYDYSVLKKTDDAAQLDEEFSSTVDNVFLIAELSLQVILLIYYTTLFILFLFLIKQKESELKHLKKQIILIFTVMIIILFGSLISNCLFYFEYKKNFIDLSKKDIA